MNNHPLVSVIVPTKNSSQFIEACLQSIKNQTYSNIEIIVVDNNSTDNTKQIARKFTDKVFNHGPERSAQRNYGAKQSLGQYLLFINSDMVLSPNVVSKCIREIRSNSQPELISSNSQFADSHNIRRFASAIIIPEQSFGQGFWAKCKALEKTFYVGVDWMEAARFFTREVFEEMNGYDEHNTGTEDYDLPQRIEQKYSSQAIGRIDEFI